MLNNTSVEQLTEAANNASTKLRKEVYGYETDVFGNFVYINEDQTGIPELPRVTRVNGYSKLDLSVTGANIWKETIGAGCNKVGLNTNEVYASAGLAILELANVVMYSVNNCDPVVRLSKIAKTFDRDSKGADVCSMLSEHTKVAVKSASEKLDKDDYMIISRLRYGLGVALKAYGIEGKDKKLFAETNFIDAVGTIERYRNGISRYLSGAISLGDIELGDVTSAEITEKMISLEFPYLAVASSNPMNVSMLLNSNV